MKQVHFNLDDERLSQIRKMAGRRTMETGVAVTVTDILHEMIANGMGAKAVPVVVQSKMAKSTAPITGVAEYDRETNTLTLNPPEDVREIVKQSRSVSGKGIADTLWTIVREWRNSQPGE